MFLSLCLPVCVHVLCASPVPRDRSRLYGLHMDNDFNVCKVHLTPHQTLIQPTLHEHFNPNPPPFLSQIHRYGLQHRYEEAEDFFWQMDAVSSLLVSPAMNQAALTVFHGQVSSL